jgi:hypothetical protein
MSRLLGRETRTVEPSGPPGGRRLMGRSYLQGWALALLPFCAAAGGCRGGQRVAHGSPQSQRGRNSMKQNVAATPVWPMARRDAANTGQADANGPLIPRLRWMSEEFSAPNAPPGPTR